MSNERFSNNSRLILGSPDIIFDLSREDGSNGGSSPKLRPDRFGTLLNEYSSIFALLQSLAGPDKLTVLSARMTEVLEPPQEWAKDYAALCSSLPIGQLGFRMPLRLRAWPRDSYTQLANNTYVSENVDLGTLNSSGHTIHSELGEGGAVLSRRGAVLVGQETSWETDRDLGDLIDYGLNVGIMPIVDPRIHDVANHIDGVATLIEDRSGDVVLLVARSYYDQDFGASKDIDHAVKSANTGLVIVDDEKFPPLAFNLIQFDDLTIAMTNGAEKLQRALTELTGSDAVHTTKIPIEQFPRLGSGSIRCLTNILPA